MRPIQYRHLAAGKRRIRRRLDKPVTAPSPEQVFTASNIHYEPPSARTSRWRSLRSGSLGSRPRALESQKLHNVWPDDRSRFVFRAYFPHISREFLAVSRSGT